jgi:chromate transporter
MLPPRNADSNKTGAEVAGSSELSAPSGQSIDDRTKPVSLVAACGVWLKIAALSFGGPAAQLAMVQRLIVEERQWLSRAEFSRALGFCTLIPGPEAQQVVTYCGWRLHGWLGGLIAGGLFILPGFLSILLAVFLYDAYGPTWANSNMARASQGALVAIIWYAGWKLFGRVIQRRAQVAMFVGALVALFAQLCGYPVIVGIAVIIGCCFPRAFIPKSEAESPLGGGPSSEKEQTTTSLAAGDEDRASVGSRPRVRKTLMQIAVGIAVWLGPLWGLSTWLGDGHVVVRQGWFFSETAVLTFGGAYGILDHVRLAAVETLGWVTDEEFQLGLSVAEMTPGPLIQVVQFVAHVGAMQNAATGETAAGIGLLAAVMTTWVTFVPSFVLVLTLAPLVEWLRRYEPLMGGLAAVNAVVLATVARLAVWMTAKSWLGSDEASVTNWPVVHWEWVGLSLLLGVLLVRYRWPAAGVLLLAIGMGWGLGDTGLVG